jgi:hypothetical protein
MIIRRFVKSAVKSSTVEPTASEASMKAAAVEAERNSVPVGPFLRVSYPGYLESPKKVHT